MKRDFSPEYKYYINTLGYPFVILALSLLTYNSLDQLIRSIFRITIILTFGTLFCSYILYRPIKHYFQKQDNAKDVIKRIVSLPKLGTIVFAILSLIYITISLILLSQKYDVFRLDLILRMLNRYTLLGSIITFFLIDNYIIGLKEHIFEHHKLIIPNQTIAIWQKMVLVFIAISVSPMYELYYMISPYITVTDSGTSYRIFVTILVLLATMMITAYIISRGLRKPMHLLIQSFKNVRRGVFHATPVISSDEMATLTLNFNTMVAGLRDREYIRNAFGKFMTEEIASEVLNGTVDLSGKTQRVTILFTDIESYTTLTESMPPEDVVKMLNDYFSKIVSIIRAHHGIVNKYIGDAVLAIFNAPIEDPDHARHGVECALAIEQCSVDYKGKILKTRVGVNTDEVLIGNIGTRDRMEYTVIGDGVNVASRLEQLNKVYNTSVLIGENTYHLLQDGYMEFELLGEEQLKGKQQFTKVYRVFQ